MHGCIEMGCSVMALCFDEHHKEHLEPFLVQRAVEAMLGRSTLVFDNEKLFARATQLNLAKEDPKKEKKEDVEKEDKKDGKKEDKKEDKKDEEKKPKDEAKSKKEAGKGKKKKKKKASSSSDSDFASSSLEEPPKKKQA